MMLGLPAQNERSVALKEILRISSFAMLFRLITVGDVSDVRSATTVERSTVLMQEGKSNSADP
jgi:hypothetical protein